MTTLSDAAARTFAAKFKGRALRSGDPEYDASRALWGDTPDCWEEFVGKLGKLGCGCLELASCYGAPAFRPNLAATENAAKPNP